MRVKGIKQIGLQGEGGRVEVARGGKEWSHGIGGAAEAFDLVA